MFTTLVCLSVGPPVCLSVRPSSNSRKSARIIIKFGYDVVVDSGMLPIENGIGGVYIFLTGPRKIIL